jgi:hypothetical protein
MLPQIRPKLLGTDAFLFGALFYWRRQIGKYPSAIFVSFKGRFY